MAKGMRVRKMDITCTKKGTKRVKKLGKKTHKNLAVKG
jgi:hypothetical protein